MNRILVGAIEPVIMENATQLMSSNVKKRKKKSLCQVLAVLPSSFVSSPKEIWLQK